MKLIKPYYKIITPINGEDILKQIEFAARTCYKSEGKIEYDWDKDLGELDRKIIAKSARVLIPKLINLSHEAMLEFGGMITVKFVCDRGVSHELVRHRLSSFAQESTRYCNYNKDDHITFIIPNWLNLKEAIVAELREPFSIDTALFEKHLTEEIGTSKYWGEYNWLTAMLNAEALYDELTLCHSWSPQQARSVLPNSLKTEINVSANIREWRHIFRLRTAKAAHPQMRELMCPLLDEFKSRIPILFDDIKY